MEHLDKLLERLSDKLGVGIDVLWSALLKQAPIDAAIHFLWLPLFVAASFGLWKWCKAIITGDDWDGIAWIPFVVAAGFSIIGFLIWFGYLPIAISGFINPEYWALKQIIK